MTLSSGAVTDSLWAPGPPVISDCWNGYSPSSCLSSLPCSPGSTGGLVADGEKYSGEPAALPFVKQASYYRSKRMRLQSHAGMRACVQAYSHQEGAQGTSGRLPCSVTPSPHMCPASSLLQPSSGLTNFCAKLSSVDIGASMPSSVGYGVQSAVAGPIPEIANNIFDGLTASEGLLSSFSVVGQPPASVLSLQPQLQQQQLLLPPLQQQLQQQLAQLVAQQPALVCSSAARNMALPLALCDGPPLAAGNQLAAAVCVPQPAPLSPSLPSCAMLAGTGMCAPAAVGGFSLPFIFTGTNGGAEAEAQMLAPTIGRSFLPCNLPEGFLNQGAVLNNAALLLTGNFMAGMPGAFCASSNATVTATAPTAVMAQLPPPASQLHQRQQQQQQPPVLLQSQTPCLSYLPEPAQCPAPLGASDPRVVSHQPRSHFQLQPRPQQLQQQRQQQLKTRQANPQRLRLPPPSPPAMPSTPPQPRSLGPEGWILHAVKELGLSEPDTARLALHSWHRVSELPQLHHATRLRSTIPAGRILYAAACLWVSIKLEEKRRVAPGGVELAKLASQQVLLMTENSSKADVRVMAISPADLCSAELAVMNWLAWRPYEGYRLDESHLLVYM